MSNNQLRCYSGFRITNRWVRLYQSQPTSYILHATLKIESQMLFLVLSGGNIMLSIGKRKDCALICIEQVHTHHFCWKVLQYSHREPRVLSTSLARSPGKERWQPWLLHADVRKIKLSGSHSKLFEVQQTDIVVYLFGIAMSVFKIMVI